MMQALIGRMEAQKAQYPISKDGTIQKPKLPQG